MGRLRRFRASLEPLERRELLAADSMFAAQPIVPTLGDGDAIAIAADFDGDGVNEYVLTSPAGKALVTRDWTKANGIFRLNHESHRLEMIEALPGVRPSSGPREQEAYMPEYAIDFDQDGDLDLIMSTVVNDRGSSSSTVWLENLDGHGHFGEIQRIAAPASILSDVDRDGDWDLWYDYNYDITIQVRGWLERVNDQFVNHDIHDDDAGRLPFIVENDGAFIMPEIVRAASTSYSTRRNTWRSSTADLDGDGDLDLVDSTGWSENLGNAVMSELNPFPFVGEDHWPMDVDSDGDIDVWLRKGTEVTLLSNDGHGVFQSTFSISQPTEGTAPYSVSVDADARGINILWLNGETGNGHYALFDPQQNLVTRQEPLAAPQTELAQALVDMNGDGKLDIVGLQAWYEQQATLADFVPHELPYAGDAYLAQAADLDGDGDLDWVVATRRYSPTNSLDRADELTWYETVDGVVTNNAHSVLSSIATGLGAIRSLDYDSDGDNDLLLTDANGSTTWVRNLGAGNFASSAEDSVPLRAGRIVQVLDFDSDGDFDFLKLGQSKIVSLYLQNDGEFTRHEITDSVDA
ncbi:MAG: VCBS repeat-containing protein, partial [Planctomycetales bacterium]|nr:VCBS repeat-containing protein [Planctomycetales bacterium]